MYLILKIIVFIQSSSIEMLQTYSEANARNISMLLLNRVSYSNIGYYYCVPSSGDRQLYSINSEKIYLFVRSKFLVQYINN